MVLSPMHYTRQRHLVSELIERNMNPYGFESYFLGSSTDAKHTDTLATDVAFLTQTFECVMPSVVLRYHAETGRTAVHCVVLGEERERALHIIQNLT